MVQFDSVLGILEYDQFYVTPTYMKYRRCRLPKTHPQSLENYLKANGVDPCVLKKRSISTVKGERRLVEFLD